MISFEQPPAPKASSTTWLVTFGDLVSLMLTFFVMLFAMSTVKLHNWEELTHAFSTRFQPNPETIEAQPDQDLTVAAITQARAIDLDYLITILGEKTAADPLLAQAIVRRLDDRVVVSLPGSLLFSPGAVSLGKDGLRALTTLGGALRFVANRLEVNGHSDPTPHRSERFASNWELSLSRALAVANALAAGGYVRDIPAYGFADSRYFDLPAALSVETRHRLARRVDLIIRENVGG